MTMQDQEIVLVSQVVSQVELLEARPQVELLEELLEALLEVLLEVLLVAEPVPTAARPAYVFMFPFEPIPAVLQNFVFPPPSCSRTISSSNTHVSLHTS